jgi:ubiquinol-cytochrome c reductase cytochrome c subunit
MQPRRHEGTKKPISSSCLRVFVAGFAFLCSAQACPVFAGADEASERGKQLYMKVGCYQCHGREAQGASTGPRLGPDPMPLAQFTRYVRAPRNEMPPYTQKVLSDAALADIHAFVSSRPRPAR